MLLHLCFPRLVRRAASFAGFLFLAITGSNALSAEPSRPNIVLIMADDK
ncbi:MAG: hypothetical protein KY475_15690 [Planctomycetes bacterium]|nr:hypothetical protein [Planctomycetota bacterium]